MNTSNTTVASNGSKQLSVERQLAELIDEVRASVGSQATLAAKVSFNPRDTLIKFNSLIEKALNNIKDERDQAITNQSSQTIIDHFNQQLELVKERATIFQGYLNELATSSPLARTVSSEQSNALSAWLDEVSPLPESEDFTEMPFQSLKADRSNVPRDFTTENTNDINIKTRASKNIDDFFLPEYVASANETEITDDILAKAKELGNSPVKIYEWVRNNVEWQPTWGGQQTADMTLDVRRGNAMDISTLMIALLRAAKIPARYVHGTVDIPVDNFINMAGDFENIDAAMDFVSAGGIPVTSVSIGGKIAKIRIEHVWVEAAVPFYPSRGSKPPSARNPIDSWIPLDGSAKQYEYLSGLDVDTIMEIDDEQLENELINSCNEDEDGGFTYDVNAIGHFPEQMEKALKQYINKTKNLTLADVIGGRKILEQKFSMLPGSLPYLSIVRGVSYPQLVSTLQVRVMLGLEYDQYTGEYKQQQILPLYELNQRNIIVSFKPASEADNNALKALLPDYADNLSELPSFLPATIKVIPQIKKDDDILLESNNALSLGAEVDIGYNFITPTQNYLNKRDKIIAGSYLALGIVGSNPSKKAFDILDQQLYQTQILIQQKKSQGVKDITRERLLGDMFSAGVKGYYAQYGVMMYSYGLQMRFNHALLPSAGSYGYEPRTRTYFGLIRGIESGGVYMNVRVARIVESYQHNQQDKINFNQMSGLFSSHLESYIPELQFGGLKDISAGNSFSASRIILKAMSEGQKIYTINNDNASLNKITIDPSARSEISAALQLGKTIVTHSYPIRFGAWSGSGYIIYDNETGDGVYKISGGINGGGNEAGVISLVFAVADREGPLIPVCYGSFFEHMIHNFFEVNQIIWGLTAPPGVTLITAGSVAEAAGGFTLITAIKLSFKNPRFLLGNLRIAIMASILNWILVSLAFEIGLLIGSIVSSAVCRKKE